MLPLHHGGKQPDSEPQAVFVVEQLVTEVAIACCPFCADDGDAAGSPGQGKGLVVVENAIGFQLAQYLSAKQEHAAHCIAGVDVLHR